MDTLSKSVKLKICKIWQKAVRQGQAPFDDGNEHIDGDSDPILGLHAVWRSTKEAFDSAILFDQLEE